MVIAPVEPMTAVETTGDPAGVVVLSCRDLSPSRDHTARARMEVQMKRFVALLPILVLAGCAAKTTYVTIVQPDVVHEGGRPKFAVQPGDALEVLYDKTCLGGQGNCWAVRQVNRTRSVSSPLR